MAIPDGAIEKYGRLWTPRNGAVVTPLRLEMDAFLMGLTPEEGGLGKATHYRNVVSTIWPTYSWHKWAELRAQAFCKVNVEEDVQTGNKFVRSVTGLAGGTDSGKSYDMAAWALVNWFVDPLNTMVIVVSTSKIDAKQRIWAALVKMYREAHAVGIAAGRLIESMDIIKLSDEEGKAIDPNVGVSDASSIMLLAAGDEYKDDAQKRLQGKKNRRIVLVIDELQDCQPSGTKVLTPDRGELNIEELKDGDYVTTHHKSHIFGKGRKISGVCRKDFDGDLIRVSTATGLTTRYTPDHICVAKIGPALDGKTILYLMRRGNSFRLGTTSKRHGHDKTGVFGVSGRLFEEGGDCSWILDVFDHKQDALMAEAFTSVKFGIPEVMYVDRGHPSGAGQERVDNFWIKMGDLTENAKRCLEFYGRKIEYPLIDRGIPTSRKGRIQQFPMSRLVQIRACNLMNGMHVIDSAVALNGKTSGNVKRYDQAWTPISVEKEPYRGPVWSMNVEDHHTYIGDGIVTHNCSSSVINEAVWGFKGAQELHVVGAGNPSSIFDPHGKFCEPIKGWMSVDEETANWKIKVAGIEGLALRFDSEKDNPNQQSFDKGKGLRYPFLPKPNDVAVARKELGELNPQYWRKFRGFWPPADADDCTIVSDILLARHGALDKPIWDGTPKDIAGIDPSYTEGGDRFVFTHMKWGKLISGKWAIALEKQYVLNRRAGSQEDFQYEMIQQIHDLSVKLGIPNQWMGVDASAGGIFWSIGERELLRGWHAVSFAGAASDLPVSAQYAMRNEATGKPQVGKELFHNMSSELCFVSRYFLECEQLKGVTPDLAWEMTQRKYVRRTRKIIIESKTDMKKRIGKSPDLFDSFSVGLFVARKVFGAMAGSEAIEERKRQNKQSFKELKQRLTLRGNW